jgi:DNA-binding MarR family transcriptional regulator
MNNLFEIEDQELRAHEDHHASLRLWLRLLSCTSFIEDIIRQNLRNQFDISLPRFDLMAQLERHRDGLTMGELSRRMMVSGGNITAIVDQLEKEQLVQRQVALADRRSFKVLLTPLGRKSFSQMAIAHEQWVIEIFSELSDHHQKQLANILGNLKVRIRQNYGNVKHQEKT